MLLDVLDDVFCCTLRLRAERAIKGLASWYLLQPRVEYHLARTGTVSPRKSNMLGYHGSADASATAARQRMGITKRASDGPTRSLPKAVRRQMTLLMTIWFRRRARERPWRGASGERGVTDPVAARQSGMPLTALLAPQAEKPAGLWRLRCAKGGSDGVGPELQLSRGIVDLFDAERRPIVGRTGLRRRSNREGVRQAFGSATASRRRGFASHSPDAE